MVSLLYTGNSSIDSLYIAGAFIYNLNVVATVQLPYLQFRIVIWDYFDNFTQVKIYFIHFIVKLNSNKIFCL